ncbi:MAG: hypothetical protein IJ111_07780 [Eggerthellaceae bacterium]|nr:hypothetical protein [Eggerthellaceae bacterium]
MDLTPYIGYLVTAALTFIGMYVATKNANNDKFTELMAQNAAQTAEIRALKEQVEKHNNVIERVYKIETEMVTVWKRIDELKEAVK